MKIVRKIINKIVRKIIGGHIRIGNFNIKIDRNQNLPFILEKYPDYGYNLVRLAKSVSDKYKSLKIFDVGGNIGDTIAMLLSDNLNYEIFSVEGDAKYLKILLDNFGNNKQVHTYEKFLGAKNEIINNSVKRTGGTLKIDPAGNKNNNIEIITLDSLIDSNLECKGIKLLKIDTDGYDNRILHGAKTYLTETKPIIYFEYDIKLLQDNGEDGLEIFDYLEELNYKYLLFFDNYGRFLVSINIQNKDILGQLNRYIKNGSFAYYDIVAFNSADDDIAESFIKKEEERT